MIAGTMLISVISTRFIARSIPVTSEMSEIVFIWIRSIAACLTLVSTHTVLCLQYKDREALGLNTDPNNREAYQDDELLEAMQNLMKNEKLYLKSELEMFDIANAPCEPEYKITRVLFKNPASITSITL